MEYPLLIDLAKTTEFNIKLNRTAEYILALTKVKTYNVEFFANTEFSIKLSETGGGV